VAFGNDEATQHHSPTRAQITVSQITADQGCEIHQHRISTIQRCGLCAGPSPPAFTGAGDQEQDQQSAHAVKLKTLPHFREEQHKQAIGLAQDGGLIGTQGCFHAIS
jgi:hypothetical protein